MRPLDSPAVYVTQRAAADPRCRARMERMLTQISGPSIQEIDDAQLAELIRDNDWGGPPQLSGDGDEADPPVLFNRFRWDAIDGEGRPTIDLPGPGPAILHGFEPWHLRQHDHILATNGVCCQTAYELHSILGCPFRCQYSPLESVLNVMLDIEEFTEHVMRLVARAPQTLFKYDSHGDIFTFEPEYGAAAYLTERFGRQDRAYLMHYTKSDNVDHLLGLNHNARSIICWTLSCNAVSRVVEHDAVPLEARAEAARRCRQAGYHVRFRLSPIFPLHNWREEYRHCIELLFSKVKPDVVSLLTLSGLPDYDDIARLFDRRLLDPEYLQAADEARDEMNGKVYGPLPHWVREEIYGFMIDEIRRVSPDTPVAICLETPEMWEALGHKLGQTLDDYVCCCGPDATPDHPKLASVSRCPPEECDPTTS